MYCLHIQRQRASKAKQSARSMQQRELADFSNLWTLHRIDSSQSTPYAEFKFLVTMNWTACLAYSSMLKMKTVYSSGASVNLYQTTRCHIPEDSTLNLNSFHDEFLP
jgi:hypothetical protein